MQWSAYINLLPSKLGVHTVTVQNVGLIPTGLWHIDGIDSFAILVKISPILVAIRLYCLVELISRSIVAHSPIEREKTSPCDCSVNVAGLMMGKF